MNKFYGSGQMGAERHPGPAADLFSGMSGEARWASVQAEVDGGARLIVRKGRKQYRASVLTTDERGETIEAALDALEEKLKKGKDEPD